MTRGRLLAAGAALGVVALLAAWLLLSGGPHPVGPRAEGDVPAANIVSLDDTNDGHSEAPRDADAARPGAGPTGASVDGTAGRPAAPEEEIDGACVLEDGTPLEGVAVAAKGVLRGSPKVPIEARSDEAGAFRIGKGPVWQEVAASHPAADLVSAEGGALLVDDRGTPFVRPESGTLRLLFRDRAGMASVRLVNSRTSEPVTDVAGLRLVYRFRGGAYVLDHERDPGLGGWIPIPEGRLPAEAKGIDVDPETVRVEFAMPGFTIARVALKELRGRLGLGVEPVEPDARGTVVARAGASRTVAVEGGTMDDFLRDRGVSLTSRLRWTGPEPEPLTEGAPGLPTKPGPFALYDLPDGSWEIEVAATLPTNEVIRGKKAFEKRGSPVDLGDIELVSGGRITVRVLDAAGTAIPQAWVLVVRPEEKPEQGRRLDLSTGGLVSVGDLEPGISHRVLVKGLPRDLEQSVTAAPDAKPVEFRWPEKLVPCLLTLVVDGKTVSNPDGRTTIPATVKESPLPRDRGAWRADGTFAASLVPGTYRFSVYATPKEGGDLALFGGEVTVPSGDSFEARLELQREGGR